MTHQQRYESPLGGHLEGSFKDISFGRGRYMLYRVIKIGHLNDIKNIPKQYFSDKCIILDMMEASIIYGKGNEIIEFLTKKLGRDDTRMPQCFLDLKELISKRGEDYDVFFESLSDFIKKYQHRNRLNYSWELILQDILEGERPREKFIKCINCLFNTKNLSDSNRSYMIDQVIYQVFKRGNFSFIKLMIEHPCFIDKKSKVLSYAIENGDIKIVDFILKSDPSLLNQCDRLLDDHLPLVKAIWMGHDNIVELLLNNGADPNKKNINGCAS